MKCWHIFCIGLLGASALSLAGEPKSKPEVWMMPPAEPHLTCMRQLFQHPESWRKTRSLIRVLGCNADEVVRSCSDDELKVWLPQLDQWGIKLGLEVGAVKEWAPTGRRAFEIQRRNWDHIQSLGGRISVMALDDPLFCVRNFYKKPDAEGVEEIANFVALVRKNYPDVRIGDTEPYPFFQREELVAFIDALQARLKQMNVRGLDFFRLDLNWNHFTIGNTIYRGNYPEVKKLELACQQRKLPFCLIYWAADYPEMQRRKLADDATWYVGIMREGYDYAMVGGAPDQFAVESWVGAPSRAVPETDDWTFTRSVRDFCERFAKPK